MNSDELSRIIVDRIAREWRDDESMEHAKTALYNEISQLPENSYTRVVLGGLCNIIDALKAENCYLKARGSYVYYFTFGSDERYPFQSTYLVVIADSRHEAIEKFRKKYPDRNPGVYNAAFSYSAVEWVKKCQKYYQDVLPADIIE